MLKNIYRNAKNTIAHFNRERVFAVAQNFIPQNHISVWVGRLAQSKRPYLAKPIIYAFSKSYHIRLDEYQYTKLGDYANFNDFFTRALKDGVRPIDPDPHSIVCPADGTISQIGYIKDGQIIQAKGRTYSAAQLLADFDDGKACQDGAFATVYLSPSNYHRVHMPFDGTLVETRYIPGDLFSVNRATAQHIPDLFARNERLVCVFDTNFGRAFVVLVGAMIVAGIECVATGKLQRSPYIQKQSHQLFLQKGAELGRFYLGSTAIIALPKSANITWQDNKTSDQTVVMGQTLGSTN